jgi:ureidoglycolate lyase
MQKTIETLTAEAFAPFGTVIERPDIAPTASGSGFDWFGELVDLKGGPHPYALGVVSLEPAPLRFDWAERHELTDELIVPMGDGCLIYVGPADAQDISTALDQVRIFRLDRGQAALLKPGVWHGAPMAEVHAIDVLICLLHHTGRQDTRIVRFEATPVTIR